MTAQEESLRLAPQEEVATMHAQIRIGFRFVCIVSFLLLFGQAALAEKKAFVVGINNYASLVPLNNSAFSAESIAKKLVAYGYKVTWLKTEKQTKLANFYTERAPVWMPFIEGREQRQREKISK
jgi:hypothetical protein